MKSNKILPSILSLIVLFILSLVSVDSYGSHLAGGEMRYEYVGTTPGSTTSWRYKIILTAFRYCGTGNSATYSCGSRSEEVYLECTSSGLKLGPVSLTQVPYSPKPGERPNPRGARDISDVCSSKRTGCEISGGVNGYEAFFWEGTIDIPRCSMWRVTYKSCTCCRNAVQNYRGASNTGLELFINTGWSPAGNPGAAPKTSGPLYFVNDTPFPSACVGQTATFAGGAVDPDGDSLSYELVCPWATNGTGGRPVLTKLTPNGSGVSCKAPIPGFKMDSLTGLMTVTPMTTGSYIAAYYVSEYEACSKKLKGKTYREIQFQVASCNNNVPKAEPQLGNLTGGASFNSQGVIEVCQGKLITWDDTLYDKDANDILQMTSNASDVLPGATVTTIPLPGAKVVARFKWKASLGKNHKKQMYVRVTDNKCDIPGTSYHMIRLKVNPGVFAGEDQHVCLGDTAIIYGGGGTAYNWKTLYGDQLVSGVNYFSQNSINSAIKFKPSQTTAIEVTAPNNTNSCGIVSSNCSLKDTIVLYVSQSFKLNSTPDTVVCHGSEVNLISSTSKPNLKYTYKWSPSHMLTGSQSKSPTTVKLLDPQKFIVTVTSDSGCSRYDSMYVQVSNPFPSSFTATASKSIVCNSGTVDLGVQFGSVDYGSCDVTNKKCIGNSTHKVVGAGSVQNVSGQNSAPYLYSTRFRSLKVQYLYTASYLVSKGVSPGIINSIGFDIAQLSTQGAIPLTNFNIKMGCSSKNTLVSTFETGLKEVARGTTHTPILGWNNHPFDEGYVWDGKSNLIVEICWENNSVQSTDHIMKFDVTSYTASNSLANTSTQLACSQLSSSFQPMYLLPRTRFGICNGINTANFNFMWSPIPTSANGGFITATNQENTRVAANSSTAKQYQLEITDTAGLCKSIVTQKIDVVRKYNVKPDTMGLICVTGGVQYLKAPTPRNISKPGGRWSGPGVINDTLGYFDPSQTGIGRFTVSYQISGDACGNTDSTVFTVVGAPNAEITQFDKACVRFSNVPEHELKGKVNSGIFRGFGVDSLNTGAVQYYIDGTKFNPTLTTPDTAYVRHIVEKGCVNDTIIKIPVYAGWDTTYKGIRDGGMDYFTKEFCATSDPDTLVVAGANPIWKIEDRINPKNSLAILDSTRGVFDPRLINNGGGGNVTLIVENREFCGGSGRYVVDVIVPPEVKILTEDFCFSNPGDCISSNVPVSERKTLIKVRIAKSPYRKIDDANPQSFVDVVTADKAQTGLVNLIESDKITRWDGLPWMIFPYKCEFAFCQLVTGRYPINYYLGMSYRVGSNSPDSICYSSHETAIHVGNKIRMNMAATGDLCTNSSVDLTTGLTSSKYSYKWSDGSTGAKLTTGTQGIYSVTVSDKYCTSTGSISVSYCSSLEELESDLQAKFFPNPTREFIQLSISNIKQSVQLSVFTVGGSIVEEFVFDPNRNGEVDAEINVSELPPGVYTFTITNNDVKNSYRVVIE